jgi:hypothetical protein
MASHHEQRGDPWLRDGEPPTHRVVAAKARSEGPAIGIAAPGLGDDFTGESEGVTEIERKVGG